MIKYGIVDDEIKKKIDDIFYSFADVNYGYGMANDRAYFYSMMYVLLAQNLEKKETPEKERQEKQEACYFIKNADEALRAFRSKWCDNVRCCDCVMNKFSVDGYRHCSLMFFEKDQQQMWDERAKEREIGK